MTRQHLSMKINVVLAVIMKIPNYDTNQNESSRRRLNDFLDEDFMLITGQTRCGKTNTLMHILGKPLIYYDKIYYYSPNHHQNKLKNLQKLMNGVSEKVGYCSNFSVRRIFLIHQNTH